MKLKVSQQKKNLLLVLAVLLAGLFFFNFLYQPQRLALRELKVKLEEKTKQYQQTQQLIKEKSAWEKENFPVEQLLRPDLLEQVNALALASGVEIKTFRPKENPAEEEAGKKQLTWQIALEGNFTALKTFLTAWEKSIPGGIMTSLEIVPGQNNSAKLQATLLVKTLL